MENNKKGLPFLKSYGNTIANEKGGPFHESYYATGDKTTADYHTP